jgi:hypothetical protein
VPQPSTCNPLKVNRNFGATRSKQNSACYLLHYGFLLWLIVWPWRWRRYVPLKRLLTFNRLQGVISQNIELLSILNVPPAYEYRKCVKSRIKQHSNDDVTDYVTNWRWRTLVPSVDGACRDCGNVARNCVRIVTSIRDLYTGFRLVSRFIRYLLVVPTINYNTLKITVTRETTSSTLQRFSCLLNSLRLTTSQLRLNVSHITLLVCKLLYLFCQSQRQSYVTTDAQSASLSWCQAPIWGLWPDFYYCQTVAGLLMWDALSDGEDGSVVYICCWCSPAQSFSGPSPVELATIFYCLRFETSLFVASYDSLGYGGGLVWPPFIAAGEPNREHCL